MLRSGCELRNEKSGNVKGVVMKFDNSCFTIGSDAGKTERFTKENITIVRIQAEIAHKLLHRSFLFIGCIGQCFGKNLNLL